MSVEKHLHVTRAARLRHGLRPARFNLHGRVIGLDPATAAAWAERLAADGVGAGLAPTAGELTAAAVLHEAMHALILACGTLPDGRDALSAAAAAWRAGVREAAALEFGRDFRRGYAPAGDASPAEGAYPTEAHAGVPDEPGLVEETWLIAGALENPAYAPLTGLFSDALASTAAWTAAVDAVGAAFASVLVDPPPSPLRGDGAKAGVGAPPAAATAPEGSLLWLLTAPRRAAPGSLAGQLRLAARLWGPYLSAFPGVLDLLLRSEDFLREEGKRAPAWHGPPPPPPEPGAALDRQAEARYTPDRAWMTEVAMVAKSTYVWLAQLSERYGRAVVHLGDVPQEALEELREDGFNALWLIGVWERSPASRNLKRARGQDGAGASAYSLYDYVVAADLGGEAALWKLEERAAAVGIRLSSDMVPNHTGLDSRWMVEHPDWFLQLPAPPFPGYSFTGPDLSGSGAIEVRVEDHYYDGTDAAVVFERKDAATGERRYVYHGNDGTAMPWNDTAQLDYLRADVREAVMATVEEVARRFPIIRFDAAMTLAKKHVQRLWHPLPGSGGAIPSRSRFAVSEEEFERRMPREFWRELVERMTARSPDTLLLAEAFWLLETYFVRELGMHRVYNSAFMHMLMREENAAYRRILKTMLAFDPRVLQRFVNFMSNPDEETARSQFGAGDKYFGVATLLATLPGLPMFGHGQVEGLAEKYGMEYLAPRLAESPDPGLVERHRREVAPLLRKRRAFAGAEAFRLFDLLGEGGVCEDAYVLVNRSQPGDGVAYTLVAYNNSPGAVAGRARISAPFSDPLRGGELRSEPLMEALGLRRGRGEVVLRPFAGGGGERRMGAGELERDGLWLELGPYQALVYAVEQEGAASAGVRSVAARRPVAAPAAPPRRRHPRDARLAGPRGVAARRAAARRRL